MRLSPFQPASNDEWPYGAPLYGRAGTPHPEHPCAFEVFPARPDEDLPNAHRIPRDNEEYDADSIGFDITKPDPDLKHILTINTFERPTLRWHTRDQFKNEFLYDPLNSPRPQGIRPEEWKRQAKKRARNGTDPTVALTSDRKTLLTRIAKLWNGETVCGVHLLADQAPSITHLTTGLNENRLKRLYYNTDIGRETLRAFKDADWFEPTTGFLKPTTVFRKQVWYDLNSKARTLFKNHDDLPRLYGDPMEGLTHRLTVGLVCLRNALRGWRYSSYTDWGTYTLDAVGTDKDGQIHAYEILTGHNNWKLHRDTYRKMTRLDQSGNKPIAVFDSRSTAYSVFNHWHREGLGELPNGPFQSDYSIENGRDQIETAYQDPQYDWVVADWTTTWKLKQQLFGQDGPELTYSEITSINW